MADIYDGRDQYCLVCPDCGILTRLREGCGMMLASPEMKKRSVMKGDYGPEAKAFLEEHPYCDCMIRVGCFECGCGNISCRGYASFRSVRQGKVLIRTAMRTESMGPAAPMEFLVSDNRVDTHEFDGTVCDRCGKVQRRIPLSVLVRGIGDRRCWECGGKLELEPDDSIYD